MFISRDNWWSFKNILLFWAITFHRMEFLLAPCSGFFHRPKLNVLLEGQGISIFEDSQIKKNWLKFSRISKNWEWISAFDKGTKVSFAWIIRGCFEKKRVRQDSRAYYRTSVEQTTNKET